MRATFACNTSRKQNLNNFYEVSYDLYTDFENEKSQLKFYEFMKHVRYFSNLKRSKALT